MDKHPKEDLSLAMLLLTPPFSPSLFLLSFLLLSPISPSFANPSRTISGGPCELQVGASSMDSDTCEGITVQPRRGRNCISEWSWKARERLLIFPLFTLLSSNETPVASIFPMCMLDYHLPNVGEERERMKPGESLGFSGIYRSV